MLLSSLDGIDFPAGDVLEFYRLRRQIELVFKRLKSLLHLDRLPANDPDLARCWIYAKIIAALLLEDMSGHVVDSPPGLHTGAPRPTSPWRIQRMPFDFIIVTAIIGPTTYDAWRAGAKRVNYRLADPPRPRTSQFDTARHLLMLAHMGTKPAGIVRASAGSCTTSRERTSGCGLSEEIGSEPSIVKNPEPQILPTEL